MAVDFTPDMKEYTNQGKFRYWVQMVLPTIYDDSLSYMELLNKVVYVINLAIEDVNTVEENVAALLEAFNELQQFTNDYFDNLDVQEEINNKLDEMVSDGTFAEILQPLLSNFQYQLDILEARVDNLSQTITPGGTSGDAELSDIRVDVVGKVYPTAGDSVRGQITDVMEVLGYENTIDFCDFFNPEDGTDNGITYSKNGNKYTVTGTKTPSVTASKHELYRGALIPTMETNKEYKLVCNSPSGNMQLAFYCYDANFSTRLAAWWVNTERVITIPEGTINIIVWLYTERNTPINEVLTPKILSNWGATLKSRSITPYVKVDTQGEYVDFNDIKETGLYLMSTSLRKINAPETEINALEVYNLNDVSFVHQVAYSITRTATERINSNKYNRYLNINGWLDWCKTASFYNDNIISHSVKNFNSFDVLYEYIYLKAITKPSVTDNGVTFTVAEDGTVNVVGTQGAAPTSKIEFFRGTMPDSIQKNTDMYVKMNSNTGNVTLRIYFYDAQWDEDERVAYFISTDKEIHVPSFAENLIIWVGCEVPQGTVINEVVNPSILTKQIEGGSINYNTFNYEVHSDIYNVTASPQITSVSDYYLQPTGDNTDRTADIITMLATNKVCRLGTGDYYISTGVDMPDGTALIGSGRGTRIILDESIENGYAISIGSYCTIQDLRVTGKVNGNLPYEDYQIGNRDGIVEIGDYQNFVDPPTFTSNYSKLSNLWVDNFTGSGIKAYRNDGGGSLLANNIDIFNCGVGVNIELFSEFHAFNNIRTRWCVHGCIMNGGNNLFSNCHFDTCIHLLTIDNSLGNLINDSHSSFTNCTLCHANNNQGNAIEIINVKNGITINNCQIFYGKTILTDVEGVSINNCNFGSNEVISLTRCKGINISNNLFGSAPQLTVNDVNGFIYQNNMTRKGLIL